MIKKKCNFCDSDCFEERRIEYLYSHKKKYLPVPNTPVEVCLKCGMTYYDAAVLKKIEQRFFAIQNKTEKPDRYIEMPTKAYVKLLIKQSVGLLEQWIFASVQHSHLLIHQSITPLNETICTNKCPDQFCVADPPHWE